jgi:hypothetical protein
MPEILEKNEEGLSIKFVIFSTIHEFAIPESHSAKVAYAAMRWMMQDDRVFILRRNPHPTTGTVLLKTNFINGPKIDSRISEKLLNFF